MKILLYGKFGQYPKEIEELVKSIGLEIVQEDPEVVLTFGGDGTLLGAERDFPGVPKLPLRNSKICHICSPLPSEELVKLLARGKLSTRELLKLEARIGDQIFLALNEICLRNKLINAALRFKVMTDGQAVPENLPWELIGDGLVVATPFGSTAYYYSITKDGFTEGIGVAFNNVHNYPERAYVTSEETTIEVEILRGPGRLSADNNPNILELSEGDKITITKSFSSAKILVP